MLELMVVLNIVMILLMVCFWVGFIFWKGSVKKFMSQLESAFEVYYNNVHFDDESLLTKEGDDKIVKAIKKQTKLLKEVANNG